MINSCLIILHLPLSSQFALWVDAVIFVFSLEDEISFQTVYHYYSRMANYRNTSEVPLVLVGTQGTVSASSLCRARLRPLPSPLSSDSLKDIETSPRCADQGCFTKTVVANPFAT